MKIVRKNDIKSNKYYSYKPLGNAFGESLYEEEFNSVLYESDQEKANESIDKRAGDVLSIKKNIIIEKQKTEIFKENKRIDRVNAEIEIGRKAEEQIQDLKKVIDKLSEENDNLKLILSKSNEG